MLSGGSPKHGTAALFEKLRLEFKHENVVTERAIYEEKRKKRGIYALSEEELVAAVQLKRGRDSQHSMSESRKDAKLGNRGSAGHRPRSMSQSGMVSGSRQERLARGIDGPADRWTKEGLEKTSLPKMFIIGMPANPAPPTWKCKFCECNPCRGRCLCACFQGHAQ